MFLGIYGIDEYVNIPAVTHRFSSGAAYAPSAITYSIYEEGNATGLDENVDMTPASPFDSVTGLYIARRQLTAAAGFENNKTYVVVVKATVDSVAAQEAHVFQIRPQQTGDSYAVVTNATYGLDKLMRTGADSDTGETLSDQMDALATAADLATVDTVVDAIKAKTDSLTFTVAGDVDVNVQSWKGSAAADMTGDSYAVVNSGTHGNAALKTLIDAVDDYVDTEVAAIKAKTDNLPASPSSLTAQQVWEYATRVLTANTNLSILDAAGIRTAVGLASANLDTQLDALPTAAEIKTALEASNSSLDYLMRAIVYKNILTFTGENEGNLEMFNAAGGSIGTVIDAFTEDATTKIRAKLVPA